MMSFQRVLRVDLVVKHRSRNLTVPPALVCVEAIAPENHHFAARYLFELDAVVFLVRVLADIRRTAQHPVPTGRHILRLLKGPSSDRDGIVCRFRAQRRSPRS